MRNFTRATAGLLAALMAATAFAGGALNFQASVSTVQSGDARSWMNPFSDWPASHPVSSGYAVPSVNSSVTVRTSHDGTNLVIELTIPDSTTKRTIPAAPDPDPEATPEDPTPNDDLVIGDQVIVQIDANGNRSTALESAGTNNIGTDYRYEIVIRNNQIVSQKRRLPSGAVWGVRTDMTTTSGIGTATLALPGAGYQVTLRIPLASIGIATITATTVDPGLAILVVNDLGHSHKVGANVIRDLTATSFPFGDMPASSTPFLDPGVLETVTAGGNWVKPKNWGTALLNGVTAANASDPLTLSRSPSPYFSDSIRLSLCNAGRFEDVDDITPGIGNNGNPVGDQTNMPLWYKYHQNKPCKMGIWARVTNTTTARQARLLVLWADAGLASKVWRVAALSPPINFGPGDSTAHLVWDQVPRGGSPSPSGSHPCLRVYIIKTNTADDGLITAIGSTGAESSVNAFESAFGVSVNASNHRTAQMNFTNLTTGDCTLAGCEQATVSQRLDAEKVLSAMIGIRSAHAQDRTEPPVINATPFDPEYRPRVEREKGAWFAVSVAGYGVPATPPAAPYVFIETIGGVGWGVPYALANAGPVTLEFNIANPSLVYRDFSVTPARELASPKRLILLSTVVNAPAGMPTPQITIRGNDSALDPGASVLGSISVQQVGDAPGILDRFLKCLRAGNILCWLIVIIIIVIVNVVLVFRRRTTP